MIRRLQIQSVWQPRDEDIDACVQKLTETLKRLADIQPQWNNWWRSYKTLEDIERGPSFLMSQPELIRLELLNGRVKGPHGQIIEELGYGLSASSGPPQGKGTEMSHLSLHCCSRTPPPAGLNDLTIELPVKSAAPKLYEVESLGRSVATLAEVWDPDWLTVWDRLTRIVSPPWIGGPVLGWINFLPRRIGILDSDLPSRWNWFERRDGNQIFIHEGGPPDASNPNHVFAFQQMAARIRWATPFSKPKSVPPSST